MVIVFILIVVVVMCATCFIMFQAQFKNMEYKVELEYNEILPYFKKRMELLSTLLTKLQEKHMENPEITAVVSETHRMVTLLKTDSVNINEVIANNVILANMLTAFYNVCKEYKELLGLQEDNLILNQLECLEEDITIAAESLNVAIRTYNVAIKMFPSSIVAKFRNLKELPVYPIPSNTP